MCVARGLQENGIPPQNVSVSTRQLLGVLPGSVPCRSPRRTPGAESSLSMVGGRGNYCLTSNGHRYVPEKDFRHTQGLAHSTTFSHTHVHVRSHTHTHSHVCAHMNTYLHLHTHVFTHQYPHLYSHTNTYPLTPTRSHLQDRWSLLSGNERRCREGKGRNLRLLKSSKDINVWDL